MNPAPLFLILSLLFSALWIIEQERRRRVEAELANLKEELAFAEFRARTATGMYIEQAKQRYLEAPPHVSERESAP